MGNIMDELQEQGVTAEVETREIEIEKPKPYQFRRLKSKDVFLMTKIIGKIGINRINESLGSDTLSAFVTKVKEDENGEVDFTAVGVSIMLEVANILFANLDKCESDIYKLLAQTSNLDVKAIEDLDMPVFFEMIVDFVKKEEFADFFGVAQKLFR